MSPLDSEFVLPEALQHLHIYGVPAQRHKPQPQTPPFFQQLTFRKADGNDNDIEQ